MGKFKAIIGLLQSGSELSNAATWRNRAVALTALSAFISCALALTRALGYDIKVAEEDINAIAGGIVSLALVVSSFLHVAADKDVGVPHLGKADDQGRSAPEVNTPDSGGGD